MRKKFVFTSFIWVILFIILLSGCSSNSVTDNQSKYSLTINTIGQGSISIDGQILTDGDVLYFDKETIINLELNPAVDWEFNQWIGKNSDELTPEESNYLMLMDGDKEITAVFVETETIRVVTMSITAPPNNVDIYYTITQAIDNANPGDVIEVCEGVFSETIVIDKDITIRSTYPLDSNTRDNTIIDGDNSGTVVKIDQADCHLYGFTIQGGNYAWDLSSDTGGILITDASPLIEYNKIEGNAGELGGGIGIKSNSSAEISNNIIKSNHSSLKGGGIYVVGGDSWIHDNQVLNNTVERHDNQAYGGGIYAYSFYSGLIEYNSIYNNIAYYGGGLSINNGTTSEVSNNTMRNNQATIGGAIFMYLAEPEIINNNITDNQAKTNGGAISVYYQSSPTIYANTITNNEADSDDNNSGSGGGIFIVNSCDVKNSSGVSWLEQNTPPESEPTNSYSGNTHYDGSNTDSSIDGADVYWWDS